MGEPAIEEAMALLRKGMDLALQAIAAQYAMPICWITSRNGWPAISGSGSAFIVDAGAGPFLVTAHHVYEEYRSARLERPDTICLLHALRFPLDERLIAFDPIFDVGTFRVTASEVETIRRCGKAVLTGSQASWPPRPPDIGKGVFFVGFPGDGRQLRPYRGGGLVEVDWVGYTALAVATSVSETGITVLVNHEPQVDIGHRERIPPDWALGGCSGAPLLTLVDHAQVLSWRLGGVIFESSETIIKVSRADCINVGQTGH